MAPPLDAARDYTSTVRIRNTASPCLLGLILHSLQSPTLSYQSTPWFQQVFQLKTTLPFTAIQSSLIFCACLSFSWFLLKASTQSASILFFVHVKVWNFQEFPL